jgi:hypothetical protein
MAMIRTLANVFSNTGSPWKTVYLLGVLIFDNLEYAGGGLSVDFLLGCITVSHCAQTFSDVACDVRMDIN